VQYGIIAMLKQAINELPEKKRKKWVQETLEW
jgi:hypothetical protein